MISLSGNLALLTRHHAVHGSDNSDRGTFAHACVAKLGGIKSCFADTPSSRVAPTPTQAHSPELPPVLKRVEIRALRATNENMAVSGFQTPTGDLALSTAAAPPPASSPSSSTPARPSASPSPPQPAAPSAVCQAAMRGGRASVSFDAEVPGWWRHSGWAQSSFDPFSDGCGRNQHPRTMRGCPTSQ